ncbi:hypothetical protein K438DRAFT_257964 [Mycena galopus ATCC 62051]|nr:hypothetical protein K438DRAFT_257964 [Mycena galopus ATCC 62051]
MHLRIILIALSAQQLRCPPLPYNTTCKYQYHESTDIPPHVQSSPVHSTLAGDKHHIQDNQTRHPHSLTHSRRKRIIRIRVRTSRRQRDLRHRPPLLLFLLLRTRTRTVRERIRRRPRPRQMNHRRQRRSQPRWCQWCRRS